jgi:hypothetical protein
LIKLVRVTWVDSAAHSTWVSKTEFEDLLIGEEVIDTVGFLARKLPNKLVLVQSISSAQVDGYFEIPRGCVKKIKVIGSIPARCPWITTQHKKHKKRK